MRSLRGRPRDFKDYHATLGVAPTATPEQIKRACRKLARKFHPDVSLEPDAEARFKEVAEAHEALSDSERRAACGDMAQRRARGQPFEPPPGWDAGFGSTGRGGADPAGGQAPHGAAEGADFSAFFEALFGRDGFQGAGPRRGPGPGRAMPVAVVHLAVLNQAFGTVPLSLAQWGACVALANGVLWAGEARKCLRRGALSNRRPTRAALQPG